MAIKKQWYEIISPKMFGEKPVGETLAVDAKSLIGRKVSVSLMEMSRNYSQFYIKIEMQVERVEGSKAFTRFVGHDIMRERVYRMVQRHGRRVDVIQDVTTKDGVQLRVKTVFMLIRRVGTSMKNAARSFTKEYVDNISKEKTFEELMDMIIRGDLQVQLRKQCSKVYPVGIVEIRKTEIKAQKKAA